jgi:hypothetical protein
MAIRLETDEFITYLNEILDLDRSCIECLIANRIPCNEELAEHPTVQVSSNYSVGILGLINGYLGSYDDGQHAGWGPITAIYDTNDRLIRFERTAE